MLSDQLPVRSTRYGNANLARRQPTQPAVAQGVEESLVHVVWRERFLVIACVALALLVAVLYIMVTPKTYIASARLYIQRAGPTIIGDQKGLTDSLAENYLYTQAEIIQSAPILQTALEMPTLDGEMRTFEGSPSRMMHLKRKLSVEVGRKDDIITVSLESVDGAEAARVVDAVVKAYILHQSKSTSEVLTVMQRERVKLEGEINDKTRGLIEFQRANGTFFVDSEKGGTLATQRLDSLSEAVTKAHLEVINAKNSFEDAALHSPGGEAAIRRRVEQADAMAISPASEENLKANIFVLQQRLADMKRQYMANHPAVVQLQGQIDQYTVALGVAAYRRYTAAVAAERVLQESFNQQQAQAANQNEKMVEYARMQSDLKRLESLAESLSVSMKEMTANSGALNITVVEPAVAPESPSRPVKSRILPMACVIGMMLGVGAAFLREWIDPRLRSMVEVRNALGIPIVGAIPKMPMTASPEARGWMVHLDPVSAAAEAYRSVYTSINFSLPPGQSRSILITSPAQGDGKSTFASNLAIAIAKTGKRVILVDADLRNPSQHRIFGISDDLGVCGILTGGASVESALRRTAIERLDILPAGLAPRNATEILNSTGWNDLLDDLTARYDHVIVDSAPVIAVSDARIVAASCDATFLVLRAGKSNRKMAESARDGLLSVGAQIAGVIVNDLPGRSGAYGYPMYPSYPVGGQDRNTGSYRPTGSGLGEDVIAGEATPSNGENRPSSSV